MSKVFIFDIDGTLTPSRLPMTEEFTIFFSLYSINNPFYLVTGSDIEKTKQQVPWYILERADALFTCCGNEMWVEEKQIYRKEFKPPKKLIDYLELELKFSPYKKQYGNHIEDRGTLLNFSIVGRDCTQEQREDYNRYDTEKGERKRISEAIKRQFPDLDAVLGGQISIDIYPKGNDKSQVLEHIEKRYENDELIFIGDGIVNGGNDYPLAHLMDNIEGCDWHQTDGWKQTKEILLEKLNG